MAKPDKKSLEASLVSYLIRPLLELQLRARLGYKAHIAGDVYSDMPLAFIVASANENEKKHAAGLLDKTVEATGGRVETLVTDSQYSSRRFREKIADCGVVAVIPYPSNQRKGEAVLRVDRYFRVYGSEEERRLYGLGRSSIERVNSRSPLKTGFNVFRASFLDVYK